MYITPCFKRTKKRILYKITNYFPSEEQRLENEALVFAYATFVIRKPTKPYNTVTFYQIAEIINTRCLSADSHSQ